MLQYDTLEERYAYLKLCDGKPNDDGFGFDRFLNQRFYASREWKDVRSYVILRDNGCDLGVYGFEIPISPVVHHIIPITPEDLKHNEDWILDPEYLISCSRRTHDAIHFGAEAHLPRVAPERKPGDTTLW